MKTFISRGMAVWMSIYMLFSALAVLAAAPVQSSAAPVKSKLVYVVPVQQTIQSGLANFLERAFKEAEEAKAKHIVLDIDTLGGRVDSAEQIGKLIRESKVPVTAYIRGKAASAGSYISLNAVRIAMEKGSSVGAAALVDGTGARIKDAKLVSHWAGEMRAAAELRGRNPQIAEGMVDETVVVNMPEIGKTKEAGAIISLSALEAEKVGYSDFTASSLESVVTWLGADDATIITVKQTIAERIAGWITQPWVMTILLFIGITGVAIELLMPGFGAPGIVGTAAFGLYFFGHYVAGFAGGEDVVLFIVGLALLVIELFVPSFGILGILGSACLIAGVVMAAYDTENALLSLGIAFVVAVVVVLVFVKLFKHRGVWNRFILKEELKTELGFVSATDKSGLVGKAGASLTPLRPAGTAMIEGRRVDVVTEGEFIPAGADVIVVHTEGTRVVVKPADHMNQ